MEIFEIEDLTFTYPGKESPAIRNINIKISKGEFVLICGESGSGKSTLLRNMKFALAPNGEKVKDTVWRMQYRRKRSLRSGCEDRVRASGPLCSDCYR